MDGSRVEDAFSCRGVQGSVSAHPPKPRPALLCLQVRRTNFWESEKRCDFGWLELVSDV